MAYIGFRYAGFAKRTELNDTVTFSDLQKLPQGIKMDIKFNKADSSLAGYDSIVEQDKSIKGATIDYECGYVTLQQEADLLGHTISEQGEMTVSADDVAPSVGFYGIAVKTQEGVNSFDVFVFYKGVFGDSDISFQTADPKSNATTYGTKTISGDFSADPCTGMKIFSRKQFDTLEEALAYVNTCYGITA